MTARLTALLAALALLAVGCSTGAATAPAVPAEAPPPSFDDITEQVSTLRGLPVTQPVRAELRDGETLVALLRDLEERRQETVTPELSEEDGQRILEALRFLPPGADLDAIGDAVADGVEGVYVPEDKVLYVRTGAEELTPYAAVIAAHEITHALQDQSFDLTRLLGASGGDGDAFLAFNAVVEGDAMVTMEAWSRVYQTPEQRSAYREEAERLAGEAEASGDIPPYVQSAVAFPYVIGGQFVDRLVDEGGYAAVDAALEDPPTTTAEIYDPQRYLDGFEPEPVEVPPAPDGWEELTTGVFGAFDLGQMLAERSLNAANDAALGWSGGSLGVWRRGEELALAAHVRFDDEGAARTTCDELPRWYAKVADGEPAGEDRYQGDRDALAVACEPGGVRFALAPDPAAAASLAGRP